MKVCNKCGAKFGNEMLFCPMCNSVLSDEEKSYSTESNHQSDSMLTKNIVLLSLSVFLILMSTILGNLGNPIALGNCVLWLSVSAMLAFFAVKTSKKQDEIEKLRLANNIETFAVSVAYFLFSFFIPSIIGFLYQVFVVVFALMTIAKIKKIDVTQKNKLEKVIHPLSIVLCIISGLAGLGYLISIFA